jgi:hypothetical protein
MKKHLIYYRKELREAIIKKLPIEIAEKQIQFVAEEQKIRDRMMTTGVIDRLGLDRFGINTCSFEPLPPNEEVDMPDLIVLLDRKAQRLCSMNRRIDVMWSGGIDSTASLLLLKEHATNDQLSVIMSEGSIDENPNLYEKCVRYMPHTINRAMNIRSEISKYNITIHGNEADTLYSAGSPGDQKIDPDLWDFYTKIRYGWSWRRYRDFEGYVHDRAIIENAESLFSDYGVQQWFITQHLRGALDVSTSKDYGEYTKKKMELRDYIAQCTGDHEYAYTKKKVISYHHGQTDAFQGTCRNVAVCADGEIIRRDQLEDLDPFDFITL